jgi:hypothetical protein
VVTVVSDGPPLLLLLVTMPRLGAGPWLRVRFGLMMAGKAEMEGKRMGELGEALDLDDARHWCNFDMMGLEKIGLEGWCVALLRTKYSCCLVRTKLGV